MFIKFVKAVSIVLRIGSDKVLELQEESRTDPLTGLFNRRGFQERIDIEKKRSDRYGHRFLIAYIDMDNLKEINDLQGHHKGDDAIIELSEVIKRNCRSTDFAARLGGDEFVVVFSETSEGDECAIMERLESESGNVSIGYHHYRSNGPPIEGAMRMAETMMREEKKRRKAKGRVI